jgi:hypothetical protein
MEQVKELGDPTDEENGDGDGDGDEERHHQ